jgi:hypothetical protein
LAGSRFAAKAAFYNYWILLDFLGFSRPKRDFSVGYTGFSLKEFSGALALPNIRSAGLAARWQGYAKGRLVHPASSGASRPSQKGPTYRTDRALPKPDISSATDILEAMICRKSEFVVLLVFEKVFYSRRPRA